MLFPLFWFYKLQLLRPTHEVLYTTHRLSRRSQIQYLCVYVCIYAFMYERSYVYVSECMFLCKYVWMNVCIFACMFVVGMCACS
jgi:hypothetical protein